MPKQDHDVDITKEDQDKINKFAAAHTEELELTAELKILNKDIESIKDAGDEILVSDEEKIPYRIGDNFVFLKREDIEAKLEKQCEIFAKTKKDISKKIDELTKLKDSLKAQLTAKLGSSINLSVD